MSRKAKYPLKASKKSFIRIKVRLQKADVLGKAHLSKTKSVL